MKQICILGATGSIGVQALDVVRSHPESVRVISMTAGLNVELFAEQLKEFQPLFAAVNRKEDALRLAAQFDQIRFSCGLDGLCEAASHPDVDMTLNALVGMIGLKPTVAAIAARKHIALANKETLVAGGALVMNIAKANGVSILPVDSEHSAIFQCIQNQTKPERITLTASGGPFRGYTQPQLRTVTREQALAHPNWDMGAKISVDSATMMNKGLEIIEAHWLFDIPPDRIDVVVHPESILHSAVSFADGSLIGQFGWPDMKIPIAYALSYPERLPDIGKTLHLADVGMLRFEKPDMDTFVCLRLAREAIAAGESYPIVLNAANEEAVAAFLDGQILFYQIVSCVEEALQKHKSTTCSDVDEILEVEYETRQSVRSFISKEMKD